MKRKMANYETWEAGTLLEAKRKLLFLLHTPDPWDFQSHKFDTVFVLAGEVFVLMFPITKEAYNGALHWVIKILHPTHGKLIACFRCNICSETWAQEVVEKVDVEK